MFAGHGEGSWIEAALISGERGDWASSAMEVLANIGFYGARESINGGLSCKLNQKARFWDDAACFAGEREEEMF